MIHLRLAGGLGNQLFQLAAAQALRQRSGAELLIDTQGLARYQVPRKFDLPRIIALPDWCRVDTQSGQRRAVAGRLLGWRIGRLPGLGTNDGNFRQRLEHPGTTVWMDGYFQRQWSDDAFDAARAEIQRSLLPALKEAAAIDADAVMHIRGGDFLASAEHRVVDADYYRRALDELRARLPQLRSVHVVTDDAGHAGPLVEQLRQAHADITFRIPAQGASDWLADFSLLMHAPARIIGNSTFSWWAAALDERRGPTVSPDQWTRGLRRDLFLRWETALPPTRGG